MRLKIHSLTHYQYEKPASFSPHLVRLFPRQESGQTVSQMTLVTEETAVVSYRRDLFDNQFARCYLPEKSASLDFDLNFEIEVAERSAFDFILDNYAARFPFQYTARERQILAPYLARPPEEAVEAGDFWPVSPDGSTVDAMLALNEAIFQKIAYEVREEGEARLPAETLRLGTGSCRDFSRLAAALLRQAGVAVRLVSGYNYEFDLETQNHRADGALHAWIEAYLPGAGWLGMDPTNGIFCDHHFIAAAVGLHPEDISPIAGRYYGEEKIAGHMTATLSIEPVRP